MNSKTLVIGLVALVVGALGGHFATWKAAMPEGHSTGMHEQMGAMMASLEGKTGDEFDKVFLSEMIMHHEGAVDMAEAALQNAKHQEIKDMANAIISAQTTEINQMRNWQSVWYSEPVPAHHAQ